MASDTLISLREARRLPILSLSGRAPDFSTIWRWAMRGRAAKDGRRVILRTEPDWSGLLTCEAWVEEFLAATAGASPVPHTSRRKQIEGAKRRLQAAGL